MAEAKKPRPTNYFKLLIGGKEAGGMFREISGLDSEQEIVEQKESSLQGPPVNIKVPGNVKWSNVELKRGVDVDKQLWEWRYAVEQKGPDPNRINACIQLCDYDGSIIAAYELSNAWPAKYTGASLNAGANEIAVEGITLAHEGFKRI